MSEENKLSRREFIKDAAIGAAAVAGAGMLGATPAQAQAQTKPWIPAKWDYEADVVIVGYGGAGTTAAITAKDAGASVLVLEKDPVARGGNTGCTGIFCIGQTEDAAFQYLKSMCWGTVPNEAVIRAQVKAWHELPAWIQKLGGKPNYMPAIGTVYPNIPGGDAFTGKQQEFVVVDALTKLNQSWNFFRDVAAAKGISAQAGTVMTSTPATDLIQDPISKEILGVKALTGVSFSKDFHQQPGGKEIYVKAKKAVILACGGYENNEEIRKNFAPHPHSAFVTFYGTPFNTGDGVVMAQQVGAKLWHMNKKECHAFACAPASKELGAGLVVEAYGIKLAVVGGDTPAAGAIYVNRDGKRFMNESFYSGHTDQHKEYVEFTHKHKPDDDIEYSDYRNVPMYWIFDDHRMKEGPLWATLAGQPFRWAPQNNVYKWSQDNQAELAKGWIIKGDTPEALAKNIVAKDFFGRVVGMDPAGLVKTISDYNGYCAAGKDLQFGRKASTLIPLNKPPYYAMEVCECQTNTDGGPEHNEYLQTLDLKGKPIPRLYSVGELGSIFGFLYNGGGNIPETYATGRVAATHALTLKNWDAAA